MWRSEPQIAARLDPDERLVGGAELGIGLLLDPDLAGSLEGDGAHRRANRIAAAAGSELRADWTPATWKRLASPSGLAVSAIRDSSASSFSKSAASPCWKETSLPSSSSMKTSTKRASSCLPATRRSSTIASWLDIGVR